MKSQYYTKIYIDSLTIQREGKSNEHCEITCHCYDGQGKYDIVLLVYKSGGIEVDSCKYKYRSTSVPSSSSTDYQIPTSKAVYTVLNTKQDKLPTTVNNKYLHTNSSTGALEWTDVNVLPTIVNNKYLHTNSSTGVLEWTDVNVLPTPTEAGSGLVWNGSEWIAQAGYGYRANPSVSINWDGDITGKEYISDYYMITNETPSSSIVMSLTYKVTYHYSEGDVTVDCNIVPNPNANSGYYLQDNNMIHILIMTEDEVISGHTYHKGIYFQKTPGKTVTKLVYTQTTLAQMSNTLIPKVTSLSSSSTDVEIPSAKCVYNALQDLDTGLSNESKLLLITLLNNVNYTSDQSINLGSFANSLDVIPMAFTTTGKTLTIGNIDSVNYFSKSGKTLIIA